MTDRHVAKDDRRHDEAPAAPAVAKVREEDLEPHEGLRYIAKLFKALALLLIFMLIAEVVIGLQQDGVGGIGALLIEATRLIVFAGFLWGAGDLAVMMVESNHDLRASRILLGRISARMADPNAAGTTGLQSTPGSGAAPGAPRPPSAYVERGPR